MPAPKSHRSPGAESTVPVNTNPFSDLSIPGGRPRCRYAPSPTGSLHLGNARTALLAYLQARSMGADFILRIEDVDLPRTVPRATEAILSDLKWLGISWDEGPDAGGSAGPYLQSQRSDLYERALAALESRGLLYECYCSRSDILRAASAPHPGEEGPVYPGTCRLLSEKQRAERRSKILLQGRRGALRICVQGIPPIRFHDEILGEITTDLAAHVGDFVLKRSDGLFAYQLVAAVDDALMGVTHVLRGDDLVSSTSRQLFLMDCLGLPRPRSYAHVPLLMESDGTKMSKRLGSMTISALRQRGARPGKIVAALAKSAGILCGSEVLPDDLIQKFDFAALRRLPGAIDADSLI